ncbi:hypothetical protein PInf_014320 [Phytophthora infestans]|nr:hypothetical protein PInf_014320 [Phytophthora infestans]
MVDMFTFDDASISIPHWMTDVLEDAGAEPTLAQRPVSGENSPKRTVLYARKGPGSTQRRAGRRELAVPNWFDLPVLLPESHPVAARIQRNMVSRAPREGIVKCHDDGAQFTTPKVSRLGSREEEEERKVRKMGALVLKNTTRRRHSTRIRKLDGLGHVDRRKRLREKVWKDLSRFGLWPMAGPGDFNDQQSVEKTVDAIWSQWQDNAEKIPLSGVDSGSNEWGFSIGDCVILDTGDDASGIFLTGVPSVPSCVTPETTETGSEVMNRRRPSVLTDGGGLEAPEEEENNEEEEESSSFGFSATRLQAKVQTPGLKRRKRLTDLHHFVETQLQKRLFRSWDTIEIAFTGSGDMTVNQIVKFLQLSDVQLGNNDAAKVQKILEEHVAAVHATQETNGEGDEEEHLIRGRTKSKAVLSFEGFRQIFHPVDPLEASRWKREFDREKFRQRQEKDIYTRELEALEEKADIIKQSIRRYWEQFEIDQWPERQIIFRFRMKKQIFYDWRAFAERSRLLCKYVLRKFVAWKYMTRKLHEHYAFYRISFWPFYVWKRHLQQMIIARGSLTRIMETELGKKIKRKSRLYDLCLGMYLKYRERDRINMIGNVIAYRRFGRIFVKYLRTTVHQGKINRFATDLGAFHVLSSRFRQWMIGTVYKLPPATQDGVEPVKKDDEAEETGEKVVLHWREDREWRLLAIANNPVRALQLRQDLLSTMESDAVRKETIRGREQLLTKKQANEDAFLRLETSATLKIKAAQMQQVQQIMRRRAHRLHDAMDNVYDVLLQQQARQQLKSSFRSLRVVVMMKYTSMLCHCAQIRNWLRLCHRFMYWERNMDHENEVRLRLQLEKRLMLAAYSERAVHKHAERSSSLFGTTAGKPFTHDKVPPFGSISEVGIICGKKVDGICVVLKASGQANIEGSIHGNPFGTHEVFSLGRGEKLVSIEGFASQSIYGLRFGTSVGRYSKWFGHCEKGSKFEVHSDFFSNREEIVGFFGHADNASINSLGVVMRHTTIKNPFEGLWVLKDNHTQHNMLQQSPHRGSVDELPLSDRQFAYFLQVRACEVLMIMERAHLFAIRAYKIEDTLPPALGNMRIIMAMARWMLNALSHGLVQRTEREEEGKQILISGQEKYAVGEKLLSDGTNTMQIVDGFRDSAGQLDAATLGVKKIIELKDKMTQAQQQMVQGERLRDEGQHEIMRSQRFLPHLPTTKRMISAIRTMYKVVQTKDEIDHMNPELRSFLLLKKSGRSEGEALSPLQ